jgi:hypothetical protein
VEGWPAGQQTRVPAGRVAASGVSQQCRNAATEAWQACTSEASFGDRSTPASRARRSRVQHAPRCFWCARQRMHRVSQPKHCFAAGRNGRRNVKCERLLVRRARLDARLSARLWLTRGPAYLERVRLFAPSQSTLRARSKGRRQNLSQMHRQGWPIKTNRLASGC